MLSPSTVTMTFFVSACVNLSWVFFFVSIPTQLMISGLSLNFLNTLSSLSSSLQRVLTSRIEDFSTESTTDEALFEQSSVLIPSTLAFSLKQKLTPIFVATDLPLLLPTHCHHVLVG
ncbi:hypothetical protein IWZ01DRAFT_489316 [Phyllosticta capitalensis]